MSSLSKKTKSQLVEIAEDLAIDISDCKVKKDVYETVRDYFSENTDKFDENSKYYELAVLSKFGSPKKTVFIEGENGDVKEIDVVESVNDDNDDDDDDETEEAEADEDVDEISDESNEIDVGKDGEDNDDNEDDDNEDNDDDDDDDDDDYEYKEEDFDIEYNTSTLFEAIQHGLLSEYIEDKNDELKDYLTDPYSINELVFFIESFFVLRTLFTSTTLGTYLPKDVLQYSPSIISNLPVPSINSFTISNLSTLFCWILTGKLLPTIISYYINFTYDFERDAFVESLAKLFIAIIVFKTDFSFNTINDEIKYNFSFHTSVLERINHYVFESILSLREVFENWVLVDALFTSILALYANLAFV